MSPTFPPSSAASAETRLLPFPAPLWIGRLDAAEGDLGRRWHQVIRPFNSQLALQQGGVGLVGFACDAGVARNHGRIGAAAGPDALRRTLANLPVHAGTPLWDAGTVSCGGDDLEAAQQLLAEQVRRLLEHRVFPIALGGGHEIAYGSFRGLADHLDRTGRTPRIGIVNLDAHFDLRIDTRASSGTPFRQIADFCREHDWPFRYCCLGISEFANTAALFRRADELGVVYRHDHEMGTHQLPALRDTLHTFLAEVDHAYLTICLDVLPASIAPGVSAPAAYGVPLEVVEQVIRIIAGSGKLRLADIAELNPDYDQDLRTARIAARLAGRIAQSVSPDR